MLQLYFGLALLLLGLTVGTLLERLHYRSIRKREHAFITLPTTSLKHAPDTEQVVRTELAIGSVVISVDYFKRFAASMKKMFGGEIRSYSSLLDRARRESMLRMKEACADCDLIINVRVETSTISNGGDSSIGSVEVMTYATALWYGNRSQHSHPVDLEE
ncbi:MAG: heavy metal-binding domain-containing protein [Planctomycetota bacterium]|nr:heavy metal-binding domain-containing protein [Planctomycetota bacterium]MDA1114199.1 heavy metal-binding domain-containing protein [Planctomycetota bacterium]